MKYCSHCGSEVADTAEVCINCGCSTSGNVNGSVVDSPSTGYCVLGFCFPIVGFILWLIWRTDTPLRAKSAGQGALISVIINIVGYIIAFATGLYDGFGL